MGAGLCAPVASWDCSRRIGGGVFPIFLGLVGWYLLAFGIAFSVVTMPPSLPVAECASAAVGLVLMFLSLHTSGSRARHLAGGLWKNSCSLNVVQSVLTVGARGECLSEGSSFHTCGGEETPGWLTPVDRGFEPFDVGFPATDLAIEERGIGADHVREFFRRECAARTAQLLVEQHGARATVLPADSAPPIICVHCDLGVARGLDVVKLIADPKERLSWDSAGVREMSVLESYGAGRDHIYVRLATPWPMQDRDVVQARRQLTTEDFVSLGIDLPSHWRGRETFLLIFRSVPHAAAPEKSSCYRAEAILGGYLVVQREDGVVSLFLSAQMDTGLPPSMMNSMRKLASSRSLQWVLALRKTLQARVS